jgi:hypothetical protein
VPKTDFVGATPTSGTSFNAVTRLLTLAADPISTDFGGGNIRVVSPPEGVAISFEVPDAAGLTVTTGPGLDFTMSGEIDENGDGTIDYSGVLLTGEVLAMGYLATPTPTDVLDFRFRATGGSMLALYNGRDIGVTVAMEGSTFPGNFASDFTGGRFPAPAASATSSGTT